MTFKYEDGAWILCPDCRQILREINTMSWLQANTERNEYYILIVGKYWEKWILCPGCRQIPREMNTMSKFCKVEI